MRSYIGKRLLAIIPIFLFATLLSFVLIHLSPVDPAEVYLTVAHIHPTEELLAEVRHEFGLDQPLLVQYVESLMKMCRLDFGTSYVTKEPVWQEVAHRMPATLQLAFSSICLAVLISVPIGFLSAVYKNSVIDHFSRLLAFFGASIPQFWLGYLLIFFLSVKLDLFPVQGKGTWAHLFLPSLTLSLGLIAIYTRLLRTSVLEQMQEPYVLYARTRGIKEKVIMGKHVLKIAISPMITGLGMNIGKLLSGTIIVEVVFSWPGFGRYFVEAILNRDIPVIQCYVFLVACIYIVCNLIVDLLQMVMDPRISWKGRTSP
ncbi:MULTISPECIES: nickel ABC transporter permease subunit NikB [unclassified Paenibacillus]|uniref:nickel ABC transporter permease subunit NikB n=1 Tax=unclassified Paenibacillus TaxID=185978 RepID=UPI002783E46F|nr:MULTISPECIES: nickel ABC transporter permease subunit NikB [unclassified Paenibacillus]MDQ0902729.1 nickel transport system permease protein [Paenibacillus sp. V4I7]MDQ0918759.1 nickel transport system permease protein [Paenibacillus sp. V4I5]